MDLLQQALVNLVGTTARGSMGRFGETIAQILQILGYRSHWVPMQLPLRRQFSMSRGLRASR